jgi:hypothetical protein
MYKKGTPLNVYSAGIFILGLIDKQIQEGFG